MSAAAPTDAPREHHPLFRRRRFANWLPLGLTYATMYMGRYNFNVVKGDLGSMFHLDKVEMGWIFTAGTWTYALAVIFNGPLADRLGGRKGILFGAAGAALMNLVLGLLFLNGWQTKMLLGLSLMYSANMYFQSFGALSVVKVNAAWFHVRERGIFGAVFGIMISSGYWLAMTLGGWILAHYAWYMVFLVPSAAILVMVVIDSLLVRDRPSHAGHDDFDTGDASSGDETPVNMAYLFKRVFTNPVILTIAAAEFCTGFVRQGVLLYFVEYLKEVHHVMPSKSWSTMFYFASTGITVGGILGGFLCGFMSDKLFQSRRAPVAVIMYACQVLALIGLGLAPSKLMASIMIGVTCMFIFGVHGMLTGAASMDFGGRKAAASAAGLLDGIQYIAAGLTGFGLGYILKHYGWDGTPASPTHQPQNGIVWVASIIPFSIIGGLLMSRLWNATPRKGGSH